MDKFTTPMMQQYAQIKQQYKDCLLFFRMGDFYELFLDDAYIGAKVLDITLTSRSKGKDGRVPMAGVPYHAVDSYLTKLVKAGYKVAICEQVSEPNKYGIVDREVVRIVTPGTLMDEKSLEKKENNFIMSLVINDEKFAISIADISTGLFLVNEYNLSNNDGAILDEISRYNPSECILPEDLYHSFSIIRLLKKQKKLNIYPFLEWQKYASQAEKILHNQFKSHTLKMIHLDSLPLAMQSAAILLGYLSYTQKDKITHFKSISLISSPEYMNLDRSTITNLELFSTIRDNDKVGTLLHTVDHTVTAMGGRLLRRWIQRPLIFRKEIELRQNAVSAFLNGKNRRTKVIHFLMGINDIERIVSRLAVGIGNARDMTNLKESLLNVIEIKEILQTEKDVYITKLIGLVDNKINDIVSLIEKNIAEDPPIELKEGGIIKSGAHSGLDKLRSEIKVHKDWVLELEQKEREKTGISSLKVRFNEVFGFYIEVSKANVHLVPSSYLRKQTLVNGERFITPELKEKEEYILTGEEKINKLEYSLYLNILERILTYTDSIQKIAEVIATLDCLINFAVIAENYNYCKPEFSEKDVLYIENGRHPVVERLLDDMEFVPNTIELNSRDKQLLIITGPNMAGKSVLIRQVALIILLAQIGSFVPADKATVAIVDRIFVRSGASDIITSGLSTFMVEMVETAQILTSLTNKSLVIMDEIGRGTSTYDGISLAWAIAEYIVTHPGTQAKTLFATHYHELQELEKRFPEKIRNYHMAIEEYKGEPIFLHTISRGGASHSHGISVARLAGIPNDVTERATKLLAQLEKVRHTNNLKQDANKADISYLKQLNKIVSKIKNIDLDTTTPLDALTILSELKKEIKYE